MIRRTLMSAGFVFVAASVAACSQGSIREVKPLKNETALVLSADARAVLVTEKSDNGTPHKLICAEPQPDALRTLAKEFAANLTGKVPLAGGVSPEVAAAFAGATREAAGELGKRTPAIQLMRDLLFRACEARINGIIRPGEPMTLSYFVPDPTGGRVVTIPYSFDQLTVDVIKQIDNMTVALHAVDGLTGMENPGKLTLSSTASGPTKAGAAGAETGGTTQTATAISDGGGLDKDAAKAIAAGVVGVVALALESRGSQAVVDSVAALK